MTYYKLAENLRLRGWERLPWALVDRSTGAVAFMREEVFRTARLCNGGFTAESPVFMGERKRHLSELERLGYLEHLDEPGELAPDPGACTLFKGGYYDHAQALIDSLNA